MEAKSFRTWIIGWAAVGFGVALALLAIFSVAPDSWHRHLEPLFFVLCPPSLVLMATEACPGWLSWCSAQYMALTVALNSLLYTATGAALWLLVRLSSFRAGRGGAA